MNDRRPEQDEPSALSGLSSLIVGGLQCVIAGRPWRAQQAET